MTTIFMVYDPLSTAQSCNYGVRGFPRHVNTEPVDLVQPKSATPGYSRFVRRECIDSGSGLCEAAYHPIEPTPTGTANGRCGAKLLGQHGRRQMTGSAETGQPLGKARFLHLVLWRIASGAIEVA
jgi:hypothetical protein